MLGTGGPGAERAAPPVADAGDPRERDPGCLVELSGSGGDPGASSDLSAAAGPNGGGSGDALPRGVEDLPAVPGGGPGAAGAEDDGDHFAPGCLVEVFGLTGRVENWTGKRCATNVTLVFHDIHIQAVSYCCNLARNHETLDQT